MKVANFTPVTGGQFSAANAQEIKEVVNTNADTLAAVIALLGVDAQGQQIIDPDTTVNVLMEVLAAFESLPEGVRMTTILELAQNAVNRVTAQDVAGFKHFTSGLRVSGGDATINGAILYTNGNAGFGVVQMSHLISTANGTNVLVIRGNAGIRFFNADNESRFHPNGNLTVGSIVDSGEKFQVAGTTKLDGTLKIGGDINPAANILYGLGGNTSKWKWVYADAFVGSGNSVFFGPDQTTRLIGFRQGSVQQTSLVGGFLPDTGNFFIQARGSQPLDTGERVQVSGTVKATQFAQSDNADAPASTTSPGKKGEYRFTENHIYYCWADNNWKRTPLSTW